MNIDLNLMKLDYCPEYFEIKIPNFRGGEKNQIYKSYLPFAMCLKCLGLIMTVYLYNYCCRSREIWKHDPCLL